MSGLLNAAGIDFDHSTECIVIGAGACGLITALRLSDAGIDTLVLERDARPAGSTSMSSGFVPAAGTRQQAQQGITDTPEQFAADIQRKANNEADAEIVRAVSVETAKAIDWLQEKHGIEWMVLDDFLYPGHSAFRMHSVADKTGVALHGALVSACDSVALDIVTQARVDSLLVAPDSSICGARIVRPDGEFEYIKASAVVLACNGYGANPVLMKRHIPEMADALYHGHAGNTGDAMHWAEQLDVPLLHMGAYQGHGSLAVGHNILITWALMMSGGVQINQQGLRFSNEHAGYSEQAVNVIRQPGGVVWNIYDERLHQLGLTFPDYQQAAAAGAIQQAPDAASLAKVTAMPEQSLSGTLANITSLASNGRTDEFGRQFSPETKLQAPYYAVKVAAAVFHTQGGLKIDDSARVLRKDNTPVQQLYAAGGAACGVSGATVAGYLSGNGLLTAVGLGFIAADTVTRQLRGSGLRSQTERGIR